MPHSSKHKGKKAKTVAVPRALTRIMQPTTTSTRNSKASSVSSNSKPSSASVPSTLLAPSSSSSEPSVLSKSSQVSAPRPRDLIPHARERDSSPSQQNRKHLREEDDTAPEDGDLVHKTKWRKILTVMRRDVETRKVSKEIDTFHDQARLIPRVVNPFVDPLAALLVGQAREKPDADTSIEAYSDNDSDDSDEELSADQLQEKLERHEERAQHLELMGQYNALLNLIPDLADDINLLEDDDIKTLAAYIKYDSGKARTTDFNHVSDCIWEYIGKTDYFDNPPSHLEKWKCGWESFVTAFLLCPPPLRYLFKQDWEKFCEKVKDPESDITITADDWPIVLFDMDVIQSGDETHGPLTGFLRSRLLKLTFKSLWTGPISARRDGARGKNIPGRPPLSQKYDIDSVSPRMLAYVAVLVRHSLKTAEWNIADLQFNNSDFFDNVVALFDEPRTPWASETLAWWDREIFGNVPRAQHADQGRKTIADLAREHHKAVRRAMKAGLDPVQVRLATKAPSPPLSEQMESSPEPVASSSGRRLSADIEEDDELGSQPVTPPHVEEDN
ncbi:hypothetical protein C8Q80DRAFT_1136527 [Daedaleopsis nitida]|nr:hypothetical protein C8Q80DRAFT_1136527 [Daedaleopsis nitida]